MSGGSDDKVASHYDRNGLLDSILAGLERAGVDPEKPTIDDLAPVDEFHTAGRAMTLRALELLAPQAGARILDAGCGIGGTVRRIAVDHACDVVGIDLTPGYIAVAEALTARTGLSDRCRFHVGSVTDLPFDSGGFDAAVSFHVAMNIEDRAAFYDSVARVLKPGAQFCVFDVMKGPVPGMHYPVPWAETEEISFLKSLDQTCALLEAAGFAIEHRESQREFAMDFFRTAFAKAAESDGPPPLGLHLLTGAKTPQKFQNYAKALEAHQIEPAFVLARTTA